MHRRVSRNIYSHTFVSSIYFNDSIHFYGFTLSEYLSLPALLAVAFHI